MSGFKKESINRNLQVDLLRGIAIVGVVAIHSGTATDAQINLDGGYVSPQVSYLFSLGKYGVELFFFISGWLLSSLYMEPNRKFESLKYAKKRVGRIYPLWIAFLTLGFARSLIWKSGNVYRVTHPSNSEFSIVNSKFTIILASALFILWFSETLWNWVIPGGWSIQAEVGHYLLFPILRKRTNSKVLQFSLLINVITGVVYFVAPHLDALPNILTLSINAWLRLNLYATFGYFFLGVLAAQLSKHYKKEEGIGIALSKLSVPASTFAIWIVSFLIVPLSFGKQIEAIAFIMISLVGSFGLLSTNYTKNALCIIGKYSYFIYFFHFLVLEILGNLILRLNFHFKFWASQPVLFVFLVTLTLAISALFAMPSFKFFESPFIRLSHRN